jgi:hypothetical protein
MNQNQKLILRDQLINISYYYINHYNSNHVYENIIPLDIFIEEILKRSHTSFFTLQITNIFLYRVISINTYKHRYKLCGRRLFIGALVVATKIHLDNNYSNKAWSVIIGLSNKEINDIERIFMDMINYNLYINII